MWACILSIQVEMVLPFFLLGCTSCQIIYCLSEENYNAAQDKHFSPTALFQSIIQLTLYILSPRSMDKMKMPKNSTH